MSKRTLPLFIFDLTRRHKLGECDFVACTDKDNGFIAKIDYVEGEIEDTSEYWMRVGHPNHGVSLRLQILRLTGGNIDRTKVRALLKQAEKRFLDIAQKEMDVNEPSVEECITFLDVLVRSNRHAVDEQAHDFRGRETTLMSIRLLEKCAEYLSRLRDAERPSQ